MCFPSPVHQSRRAPSLAPQSYKQLKQLAFRLHHLLRESRVGRHLVQTCGEFAIAQVHHGGCHGLGAVLDMAQIDANRAAMRWYLIDIKQDESVRCENFLDRDQREVNSNRSPAEPVGFANKSEWRIRC